MRFGHTVQLPVWVVLPIIVVVIGISVVSYQIGQRSGVGEALTPAGDQGVQVGADDLPRSAGGTTAGTEGLVAWASAAAVGDYVTAQQHMEEDPLLYGLWKDEHAGFVDRITGYRILRTERVGQTTTARVQFDTDTGGRCITVQVNEQTQKVRADRVYGPCAGSYIRQEIAIPEPGGGSCLQGHPPPRARGTTLNKRGPRNLRTDNRAQR